MASLAYSNFPPKIRGYQKHYASPMALNSPTKKLENRNPKVVPPQIFQERHYFPLEFANPYKARRKTPKLSFQTITPPT